VWLGAGGPEVSHYIDITDSVERKVEALLCHKSQLPDPETTGEMVRSWAKMNAASAGLADGRYAEAVRIVNTG
jgi:LmbE family N-acetylglucosaminyl deacetylase